MAGPRSIWNGTISFGLVTVPIAVHSATEDKGIHFHEVHASDGARVEHRRFCAREDREVPYEEVVKGYEVSKGRFVVLEKEEIAAAAGEQSRLIAIDDFVCANEIDPIFYDKTYFLGSRDADDAYRLLHDALEKAARVGIGRWTFHNREYLVAIRPYEGLLALHTMRFAAELVTVKDIGLPKGAKKPTAAETKMAAKLIESLHAKFDATDYEDSYRADALAMIKAKGKGKRLEPPGIETANEESDLAAALEASLK